MRVDQGSFMHKALWITTIALAAMPILGMRPMVLLIVVWVVLAVFASLRSNEHPTPPWRTVLILSAPFALMLLDIARASSWAEGWHHAERGAALAIFPIGFLLLKAPSDEHTRRWMTTVFSMAATGLAIYINAFMYPYLHEAWEVEAGFSATYRFAVTDLTGVHPPYVAYWLMAAALFPLDTLIGALTKMIPLKSVFWRSGMVLLLISTSLFIGSRMPLFAFGVAFLTLLFMRLHRTMALRVATVSIILFGAALIFAPGIKERMLEMTPFSNSVDPGTTMNSIEVRDPIIQCTMELLEEHWLLGVGGAQLQPAMNAWYVSNGLATMTGYGTHDQLMNWWLSFGVLGLGVFILLFGWSMRTAWSWNDAIHLAFLLFMLLCCFTEDLLTRQWGVVLFACFNSLFVAARSARVISSDPVRIEQRISDR